MTREYRSLQQLKSGGVLDLGGLLLVKDEGDIEPGDLYVAERNDGPKLLTCDTVNHEKNYVIPTTNDYPFDLWECVKVREYK